MANVSSRLVVLLLGTVGCATAGDPNMAVNPDAPEQRIDAPQERIDAPHAQGSDDAPPSGSCTSTFTGVLAAWDLTTASGSQASTPSSQSASGLTASSLTRSSGLTATSGSMSMNSSGWATSATLDASKYYTVTLTPPTSCTLDVTSLALEISTSATGPASAAAATSADSFAGTVHVSTSGSSTPALSVSGATGALEIQIYGFDAESASGTMRLSSSLSVSGSIN